MATLPPPLNLKAAPFEASGSSSAAANKDRRMQSAEQLVLDLCDPDLRENALLELSKVKCCVCLSYISKFKTFPFKCAKLSFRLSVLFVKAYSNSQQFLLHFIILLFNLVK